MNDEDLHQQLRQLSVPRPDSTALERARFRAAVAFDAASQATSPPRKWPWRGASVAGLAALVAAAVVIYGTSERSDRQTAAVDRQTLKQFDAVFPGQVSAVVEHDGQVELALAEGRAGSSEQPLLVQLDRGGKVWRILSYSGRQVRLDLEGRALSFEVFLTPDGQVILAGSDFLWTSPQSGTVAGFRVSAHSLSPAS